MKEMYLFELQAAIDEREKWSSYLSGKFKQLSLIETWKVQAA